MVQVTELVRENEDLRDRLLSLSEASLRINESLELDDVLQRVLDSARALTSARYGVLTTVNDLGRVKDFLTSGMTHQERRRLEGAPGRRQFFDYSMELAEPVRVPDFRSYFSSVGLNYSCPLAVRAFLTAPIRHCGKSVGYILLGKKVKGEEFSPDDERTLTMFASQAAMVIANARRYQDEQRARADLETLIDTSPVGVVVFDTRTNSPVCINREMNRIVEVLRNPGQSDEQLLATITCQRSDGREISLEDYSLSQVLCTGETVRAEEIVLKVPGDRSVSVIMNATPIRPAGGDVESVVVTLQDMTPLEDLERMRAEFLAVVSHELREPLTSIKGSITTLLDSSAALNPAETLQFHKIIDSQSDRLRELISDLLDVARIEMGMLSVSPEPSSLTVLIDQARNIFLSATGRDNVGIKLAPDLPWVMVDRLRIVQVLSNLLSNAARHSPESAKIRIDAVRDGVYVAVSVSDSGSGLSADRMQHLFRKFSRIDGDGKGRGVAGSGLGLAICKGIIEAHGGRIWAESDGPGMGSQFTFTIPVEEESVNTLTSGVPEPSALASRQKANGRTRILVVDDDPQTLRYVRDILTKSGYEAIVTGDPEDALRITVEETPHMAVLDLMLPGTDGIGLMKTIREASDIPVMFLSAYGQEQIIATAFDMGAADYVVKPFSPTELSARIRAALRKRVAPEPSRPYLHQGLAIDYQTREVRLGDHHVQLTAIEFRMLAELSANAGRVLTYEHLLRRVYGLGHNGDLRPMRTVVCNLRRKLGDSADEPRFIFTEPRVGYRMPRGAES